MRATRSAAVVAVALLAVTGVSGVPAGADEVRDAQWHLSALRVAEAHRHSLGDGLTVAVLDSGVDGSHPDLRDNVLPGFDLTERGSDGRDDPTGSGTALAGLIAGHGHGPLAPPDPDLEATDEAGGESPDDGTGSEGTDAESGDGLAPVAADGVLGLAPRAAILPVVVADPGASPEPATLAAGIDTAVASGAQVICLGRPLPDHPAVTRALGRAVEGGALVVVPAVVGGDALARYGEVGLLGAVALGDGRAVTPPAGDGGVVAVPAIGVTSTGGQGGYYRYARTADAAASALLAGAVALVRATHPDLPAAEVARRITETSDRGSLDLVGALTEDLPPPAEPPAGTTPEPSAPPEPPGLPNAGEETTEWVAAFDSDDWRRWLVATPLVVFVLVLVTVSVTAARRARR